MDTWTIGDGIRNLTAGIFTHEKRVRLGGGPGKIVRFSPPDGSVFARTTSEVLLRVPGNGAIVLVRSQSGESGDCFWSFCLPESRDVTGNEALRAAAVRVLAEGSRATEGAAEYLLEMPPRSQFVICREGELRGRAAYTLVSVSESGEVTLSDSNRFPVGGRLSDRKGEPPGPAHCVGPYPGRWCPASMDAPSAADAFGGGWVFFAHDPAHADGAWRCPRCVAALAQVAPLATEAAKALTALGKAKAEPWRLISTSAQCEQKRKP